MASSCQPGKCRNGGRCVPTDGRVSEWHYTCICPTGYSGDVCQTADSRIDISFRLSVKIPPLSLVVHFIAVRAGAAPIRASMLRRIAMNQDIVILRTSIQFNILLIEFSEKYYLIVMQELNTPLTNLSTEIVPSQRCLPIQELFNHTLLAMYLPRRIKYYHLTCKECSDLRCFFDKIHMCLYNEDRHANCFDFNHEMKYDCQGTSYCQNGADCFQDHPTCPRTSVCVCRDCYYGSRCQFSTKGFGLFLEVILGSYINPHVAIKRQSIEVRVTMVLTIIMVVVGTVSGLLSIMAFHVKKSRRVGCAYYILASSITSILTMAMFNLKFWLLLLSQMQLITNRTVLFGNCVAVDFLLRISLSMNHWLNACVTVERSFTATKGLTFDKNKSKRYAKGAIFFIIFLTVASTLHDPIHRRLFDDIEEERTWCLVKCSPSLQLYDTGMVIFHFLVSFSINLISALVIIATTARQRSSVLTQQTYREHLRKQFHQHKHILASLIILVLLSLPRLIIAFVSSCMKSARNPWLHLAGYVVSIIPHSVPFFVFVLPSETYKKRIYQYVQTPTTTGITFMRYLIRTVDILSIHSTRFDMLAREDNTTLTVFAHSDHSLPM